MFKKVHVSNCVLVRREENPNFNPADLIQHFSYPNPQYYRNERLGFSNYGIPRDLCLAGIDADCLKLPRGLVSKVLKMYPEMVIVDETIVNPTRFNPSQIILKDYQQDALISFLQKNQGVLVSPPGSGKTVFGIELIVRTGQRTLVLVHTLDLLRQWQERFKEFTDITTGVIQGDQFKIRDVTIGMTQSLGRPLDQTFTRQFGMVLLDECHHAPASTFQQLIDQFPARHRYGLTATPTRADGLEFIMTAILGPVVHQVDNSILVENGGILKPAVHVIQTNSYYSSVESYPELLAKIVKDEARNRLIVDLVSHESTSGHYCLVLSARVRHAQELHRLFTETNPDIKSYCITGQDFKDTRQQAIAAMNQGTGSVLFSTKLADEGLDIRRLDRLFLTCPGRAISRVQQQVGRIQRTFPGKKDAIVYDFLDINNLAKSQFQTRKRYVYAEYEIEILKEDHPAWTFK